MVRKLKHHEQRLLKKVDFYTWDKNDNLRESHVIRRYMIQKREDYVRYNKLCGYVTKLANEVLLLKEEDPFRAQITKALCRRLYAAGVLATAQVPLSDLQRMTVASICRRRLAVVLVKLKMCETLKEATTLVEQGHVRIGPETVKDPAFLVTRDMEDLVQWLDRSKIRQKIMQYQGTLDDYDLLN